MMGYWTGTYPKRLFDSKNWSPSDFNWLGLAPMQPHPVDALSGLAHTIQGLAAGLPVHPAPAPTGSIVDALAGNNTVRPVPMGWGAALLPTGVPQAPQSQNTPANTEKQSTQEPAKTTKEERTTQTADKVYSVPTVQQTANANPMVFGNGNYVIPNTGYTAGGVYIDPVAYGQDNGGLQHADMGILHQQAPASFGQALAFANLMQGHRGLSGGIGDMTRTMQDIDKANAYQAQGLVANRVQDLMHSGYGADEARYMALTEYGLENGYDRMAMGAMLPEYAKAADEQAKRRLDTLAAMGGTYQARTGFGYTPLGIENIERNSDGTANAVVNGQRVTNISPEFLMSGVYGAVKGNGAGASNAANAYVDGARTEAAAMKDMATIAKENKDIASGSGKKTKEDELELIDRRYEHQLELLKQKNALKNGVTSGIDPTKWKF